MWPDRYALLKDKFETNALSGSVSTAKAQKLFISCIPIKSWMVWRCRKCGWDKRATAECVTFNE